MLKKALHESQIALGQPMSTAPETTANDPAYLDRLIDEFEAADFLGYSVRALRNWRVRGGGPRYVKVSARSIRYRRRDLIAWADARLCNNTSDTPEAFRQSR
jgi:predicted DNA-binding transcriptional regulator AlpA